MTKLTARINRSQANRGAAIASIALTVAFACATNTTPGSRVPSAGEGPPSSRALLRGMTDYLRAQQAFSFRIETSFEIFDSGLTFMFGGRTVWRSIIATIFPSGASGTTAAI